MVLLTVLGVVFFGGLLLWGFIKGVNALFRPLIRKAEAKAARLKGEDNPYIQAHKMRQNNDQMYEEYLNWMDRTGGGLPIDKIKTPEERRFEKQMNG
ncbi:hypothetical protein [uncultured Christiangramia sp.]|uniref:OadG family protein n=1 Tax=uncultured Christiangramia sp. TaxID=503836 RepID=UPI00262D637A|nr:hypothetical protein [uncultured Christiangramia sp.]